MNRILHAIRRMFVVAASAPTPDAAAIQYAVQQGYECGFKNGQQVGFAEGERYGRQAACDDLIIHLRSLNRSLDSFEIEDVEFIRARQVH
jgi:flagellar biosynthesis/type III secretory pathway protein FliH